MSNSPDSDPNNLSDDQLALLHQQKRYLDRGVDPTLVPSDWAEAVERHGDEIETLEAATRPLVVDAADAGIDDRDAARDALEAIGAVDGSPRIVSKRRADRLDAAEDALREIVQRARGLDESTTKQMDAVALCSEIDALGRDAAVESLTGQSQMPETGGAPAADEPDDPLSISELGADEKAELEDLKRRRDVMADRTPQYAETLEDEIAALLNADSYDEIAADVEVL